MNRTLALVFVVLTLVVVGEIPIADAKPKTIAVTPIGGDESGAVGDAVADALEGDELTLLAPKAVTRAIDKLGYDEETLNEKQARKVASELKADAVVQATLDRDGKHKVLQFRLFIDGKKARGFKVTFNNAKSNRFRTMLREKLVERIAGGGGDTGGGSGGDEEDDPLKTLNKGENDEDTGNAGKTGKGAKGEGDEDSGRATKGGKRTARSDQTATDDEGADVDAAVHRRVSPHTANRVAVRVDLGVSVQNRRLLFSQRENFPEGPKPYTNSQVPGARIEGELYPFAFLNPKSILAMFGFAGEYDKTLSLTLYTTAEMNTPVKATQQHWSIGGRVRIPFGGSAKAPTLTLGAGIGRRTFKTNRSVLMDPASLDVPDVNYKMIDPGLTVRIPITSFLAFTFGGKALIVTDAGAIQQPSSYGRAKVFGGSGQAGFDIVLGNRFAIRLVGEFIQVGFSFTGTGTLSNARDNDPSSKDVGGASDRSFGGAATLGVLY